ncbi:MAG: hypothetical protein ACI4KL_03880 [Lentihominibacter sp.]
MKRSKCILGIDTSNYKTSIAVTDEMGIVCDLRRFLSVKQGERGLRQSEAMFQHVKNLPELFGEMNDSYGNSIAAVAYSERPRPVEGSYMPCFLAGKSFAESLASVLGVPALGYSHQEGHIEAVRHNSGIDRDREFIACHFSGGTCEIMRVKQKKVTETSAFDLEILGGSLDISFGQLIDRTGVAAGLAFPCGEEMDRIAVKTEADENILSPIKVKGGWVNLSGIETQIMRKMGTASPDKLFREVFRKTADGITMMLRQITDSTGLSEVLLSGGVSSSKFLRDSLRTQLSGLKLYFDGSDLSSDNAVGTAFLGGRYLWD